MVALQQRRVGLAFLLVLAGASCSGGSAGAHAGTTSFQLDDLSLRNGSVWQVNREIVFSFSGPVDFATVSANTINIRSVSDVPAIGVFQLRDPLTVVFQPSCPTLDDFSDAGLLPGVTYVLRIPGKDTSANTVRSLTGVPLGLQQTRTFSTPASNQASVLFRDARSGAPAPVLRARGSTLENATRLEIGDVPDAAVYFELEADRRVVLSDPAYAAPLNLYSDPATHIAFVIAFDQPVNPSADNISANRLRLEFRDGLGAWRPLDTRVTLLANCTDTGSSVRLEPVGVLPRSSAVRAVISTGFRDLVGESVRQSQTTFAVVPTRAREFTSLSPADVLADEVNDSFAFGGDSPLSFQDTAAPFDTPVAVWGDGQLSAAFSFEGTGGPAGEFDWLVHAGELFFFDTTSTPIIGGRNGAPNTSVTAVNGIVDVRHFIIEAGGEVRVQGPNPMRIRATGDVVIRGRLDLSGFPAKMVATLNTGNQVEIGGAGAAGGGKGGSANDNTRGPTPRGGRGQGPFLQGNFGGEGGEMGFSQESSKNARRPGGGGGGRFSRDWVGTTTFSDLSLAARPGSDGNPRSRGAESGVSPARGGSPGTGPFLDTRSDNDFFGVRPLVTDGELTGLVRGELQELWAGYGGGGGGNAGRVFPNPNWRYNSDEKGGGGGGGAGGLHVQALGRIVFGEEGVIVAIGARGATGENTAYIDHIGGIGGGGSGGHVILESAVAVDFTDGGASMDEPLRDIVLAAGPKRRAGPNDAEYVDSCRQAPAYCCPSGCGVQSNGGAGGAGVIQLHVRGPADIVVPAAALLATDVLDQVTSPPAYVLIPTFGRRSKARSDWISIGGADQRADGSAGLVRFLFDGIDPTTGRIQTDGGTVRERTPLVNVDDLGASATARILADGLTLEFVGAALDRIRVGTTVGVSNDVYLRTPALLEDCSVRMFARDNAANHEDFTIAAAAYAEGTPEPGDEALRVMVGGSRSLRAFDPGGAGVAGVQLVPRFFQVSTNGLRDSLPGTAFVSLRFQAAADNGAGAPDEADPLQDWTADISTFNSKPAGALQFFRYEVEFDLDKDGLGVTADTALVALDFLKIPFVF